MTRATLIFWADPSVTITGIVAQLSALPLGRLFEKVLPRRQFRTLGYSWSLNPGPFNIKEHTCVTVMANVVVGGAYATDVVATQRAFYNQNWGFSYTILLILSSQLIGYSFAGVVRQFLVWPSSMIWPGALVNAALFNTLHKNYGKRERGHMTRERFFALVVAGSCVWYWVPGFLWTGLSVFNWACWIAPQNVVVNQLFGTLSGLGMGIVTFDWAMIAYFGSPLVMPWWSAVNTFAAFFVMYWVLTPILYCASSRLPRARALADAPRRQERVVLQVPPDLRRRVIRPLRAVVRPDADHRLHRLVQPDAVRELLAAVHADVVRALVRCVVCDDHRDDRAHLP
jgi:OPT family oligopeptide transporter